MIYFKVHEVEEDPYINEVKLNSIQYKIFKYLRKNNLCTAAYLSSELNISIMQILGNLTGLISMNIVYKEVIRGNSWYGLLSPYNKEEYKVIKE